jgi:hypothetical protein
MNLFNRIVTALLFLVLLVVSVLVAIAPAQAVLLVKSQSGVLVDLIQSWYAYNPFYFLLLQIALVVASTLLFGGLFLLEIWPRRAKGVVVRTESGTKARMETDSISRRLAWHLDQLAGVISVVTDVRPSGKRIDLNVTVEAAPDIDVPSKTEEITNVVKDVVENRLGLEMGKLHVFIKYSKFPPPQARKAPESGQSQA